MRVLPFLICFALSSLAHAQLTVDGRRVAYDSLTNTMLATVPRNFFNQPAELNIALEDAWQHCTIDDEPVADGKHLFSDITAEKAYRLLLTDRLGNSVERRLEFTFLPIVELVGTFGNAYQEGLFLLSQPDYASTDTLEAKIRWRGGTTNAASKHKRNYKINFPEDHAFFGLRNDDKWMLDAGQPDVFRLRNRIAMDLWNDMAPKPYYADREPKARNGVGGRVVEVFLNDEYRGIYNFSELIDRKQMKLKKVDKETGQIRGCLYKGVSWASTQMFDSLTTYDNTKETLRGFEVKYPDLEDSDTTDWRPLVEAINVARTSPDDYLAEHVEEYFDLEPIFYYSLFMSTVNAVDNSGKNMYWAVYDKTADRRLTPAPWDLDATFGQRWGGLFAASDDDHSLPEYLTDVDVFIFYWLYKTNYKGFNDRLNRQYRQLRQPGGLLSTDSLISRFTDYYEQLHHSGADRRETLRWSGDTDLRGEAIDFYQEYQYICQWITQHMQLIDQTTFPLYYNDEFFGREPQGIANNEKMKEYKNDNVYDLSGRKLSDRQISKGIYIRNGRKFIVK